MTMSQPGSAEKTIRKIDIAQVSLSLQDRLGLAKLKYQHGRLHGLNSVSPLDSDKPSDSSSDFSRSRCETPFTSPPLQAATYSKELPRSARNKHAVTFNSRVMQPMLSASRKRLRSDSGAERPAKVPRVSWKRSYQLPESSPGLNRHLTSRQTHVPFMSEAPIPELSSPVYHGPSDEENDPDLPLHSFQNVSSMVGSSPPRTPPPKHARLPRNDRTAQHEDGADLLLYLANSPTPARVAGGVAKPSLPAFNSSQPTRCPAVVDPGSRNSWSTIQLCRFRECDPKSSPASMGWPYTWQPWSNSLVYQGCSQTTEFRCSRASQHLKP
ncbi:hypothetical protein N7509_008890 [Penicillium cosmopolitanum]|uniref:Uncharacterized protein n=1 Tax=Penicillium cosmopolitanum TaxID=1131564 RepID=A0A9W9VNH6_9EURO|nr:uncharacterized protein N7509_008890 [Penicillium cosmopolitanum]KAJ5386349.1 hypothetical protein N7509_008890 [Penicillium cosmopolitanum]